MSEIGGEVGRAVVNHAMYISTLAVAILSGMVIMRFHFKMAEVLVVHWMWMFWVSVGFAALTVGMGLIISVYILT